MSDEELMMMNPAIARYYSRYVMACRVFIIVSVVCLVGMAAALVLAV